MGSEWVWVKTRGFESTWSPKAVGFCGLGSLTAKNLLDAMSLVGLGPSEPWTDPCGLFGFCVWCGGLGWVFGLGLGLFVLMHIQAGLGLSFV